MKKYPQNPSGMPFYAAFNKKRRSEISACSGLFFGMSADPYFSFLEVSPVNNFLFQLYGKKACLTEG